MSGVVVLVLLSSLAFLSVAMSSSADFCSTLYLLHVVPVHTGPEDGWDRGLEVIPAGHLAVRQVNSLPQLLNGSRLELIDVPSEPCGVSSYSAYVDIVSLLSSSQQKCVFGVIGLYCTNEVRTVAPPLSNPHFGYIQLSSAVSPHLQNAEKFPYLFRVIASSEFYGDAALQMMVNLNWTKISVVYNFTEIAYRKVGQTFAELVDQFNFKTLAAIPLPDDTEAEIRSVFEELAKTESRVIFWSVSAEESGKILCEAYSRKLQWPSYVHIFADRTIEDVLSYNASCSPEEMKQAVEGAFFLRKRMSVHNETVLVSGQTFKQYKEEYLSALGRSVHDLGMNLEDNEYANTLYDQVWAFALAMNFSLSKINTAINDSFKDVLPETVGNRRELRKALLQSSFQGASGTIIFDEKQEVPAVIDIFHARNGIMVAVGEFQTYNNNFTFYDAFNVSSVPPDSFGTVVYRIPIALTGVIIVIQTFLLVLVLVSVTAITYWRARAEVKSTSLHISYMMLVGAFLLCISPMLYTLIDVLDIPARIYSIVCNVELWIFFVGINIIVVCLLFRLLRIVYVFRRSFHSTGKCCSGSYLTSYILLTCCVIVIILIIWVVVDPLRQISDSEFKLTASPPHVLEYRYCSSKNLGLWLGLSYAWIGFLLVVVICLAILTRKIKREHFKDTKKVNVFVFSIFVTCAVFLPLSRLLEPMHYILVSFILRNSSHVIIILLSQILLFMPKYVPLLLDRPSVTDRARTRMRTMRTMRTVKPENFFVVMEALSQPTTLVHCNPSYQVK